MYIPPEELLTIAHTLDFDSNTDIPTTATCKIMGSDGFCRGCKYSFSNNKCALYYEHNPDLQQSIDDFKQLYPEYFI